MPNRFFYALQCEQHGELNGTGFPALTAADPNIPPAAACPIDTAHKVVPGSLRLLYTTNPPFLKVGLIWQQSIRFRTISDAYVSDPSGNADFMFSTRIVPVGTILRAGLAVKRDDGSAVTSVEIRVVLVNPDGSDGTVAVDGAEVSIPLINDEIQLISSPPFVLADGFNLYRFQVKRTGGLVTEGVTFYHGALTALLSL